MRCYQKTVIRVCLPLLGVVAALCLFAGQVRSADPPRGLQASAASPVHPVLIRNEHGPLVRVDVELAEPQDIRAKAFSFTLDGTDDLADIESLTLYSTADKEEFSSAARFGEPAAP